MPSKIYTRTYLNYVCLTDEDPAQVDSMDLAHSLSLINRFNGHTKFPYSVAQHCLLGAKWLLDTGESPSYALYFLLHDAHEAYLGDIARPVMRYFGSSVASARREIEGKMARWQRVIIERFDLEPRAFSMEKVIETDECMLATEKEQVLAAGFGSEPEGVYWPNNPLPIQIEQTHWGDVKGSYLSLLDSLYLQHSRALP